MAVKVKVTADTDDADKAIQGSQEKAGEGYKKLEKIAEQGLKAAQLKEAFGGIKQAATLLSPELDKLSDGLGKNIKGALDFGDAGQKMLAPFGPEAQIIGGVMFAVMGYFIAAQRQADELRKKVIEMQNAAIASRARIADLDDVTMGNISAEIDKVRDKIYGTSQVAQVARDLIAGLLKTGANDLADSFDKAAASADKATEATKAILKPVAMTSDQAAAEVLKQQKLIEGYRKDFERESGKIHEALKKGYLDEPTLKLQEKLLAHYKDGLAEAAKAQADAATAFNAAIKKTDDDAKKAGEDADKRQDKLFQAYLDRLKAAKDADDKYTAAIVKRELAWYADRQAAQEWAETVKRVEGEVAIARIKAADQVEAYKNKQRADDRQYAEEKARLLQEDFDRDKAAYEKALQPFAQVTSAVFDSIAKNIEAGKRPLDGFKQAFKSAISEVLKSLGKQWGAQALGELAAGFASLALGPVGGVSAAGHFTSAAIYGTAAVAAGVGGAVAGRSASTSSGSSAPAASSGSGTSNPSLGKSSSGFSGGGTINVTLSNNMFLEGNDRDIAKAGNAIGNAVSAGRSASFLDTGQRRAA